LKTNRGSTPRALGANAVEFAAEAPATGRYPLFGRFPNTGHASQNGYELQRRNFVLEKCEFGGKVHDQASELMVGQLSLKIIKALGILPVTEAKWPPPV
jgi:hypothetical protein